MNLEAELVTGVEEEIRPLAPFARTGGVCGKFGLAPLTSRGTQPGSQVLTFVSELMELSLERINTAGLVVERDLHWNPTTAWDAKLPD